MKSSQCEQCLEFHLEWVPISCDTTTCRCIDSAGWVSGGHLRHLQVQRDGFVRKDCPMRAGGCLQHRLPLTLRATVKCSLHACRSSRCHGHSKIAVTLFLYTQEISFAIPDQGFVLILWSTFKDNNLLSNRSDRVSGGLMETKVKEDYDECPDTDLSRGCKTALDCIART